MQASTVTTFLLTDISCVFSCTTDLPAHRCRERPAVHRQASAGARGRHPGQGQLRTDGHGPGREGRPPAPHGAAQGRRQ